MSADEGTLPTLQVLIVEDTDTDYLLLERKVQKLLAPMACARAANRSELTALLQQPWDIIISDYHLQDIEGEALLTLIEQRHRNTPCILLSGSIDNLITLDLPDNVIARIEKGNSEALRAALLGPWRTRS